MKSKKSIDNELASIIRLLGFVSIIAGIIYLASAFLTEIEINPNNIDADTLIRIPKEIAEKTNKYILGGFLIIIGIQLCSFSTSLITEIRNQFKSE